MGKRVMMQIQTLLAEIIEGFILEVIVIFNLKVKNHSHKELMKSKRESSLKEIAYVSLKRFEAV